jgi:hypothetical protein
MLGPKKNSDLPRHVSSLGSVQSRCNQGDFQAGSLFAAPDGSVTSRSQGSDDLEQPPIMERWIQTIPHPGMEYADNPLQMAPHNSNFEIDQELGLGTEHFEHGYQGTLTPCSAEFRSRY